MANWQFTIHLADLFHRTKEGGATLQELAAAVVFNLEQIRRSADRLLDVDVDALAYEFQDIADQPSATVEEYDTALRHLFKLDPRRSGATEQDAVERGSMKKLPKAVVEDLSTFLAELQDVAEKAQDYFDSKSEAWQESDAGTNYQSWVETLDAAVEALENIADSPGGLTMTANEMLSTLALALALLEARRRSRPDIWDLLRPEPKREGR